MMYNWTHIEMVKPRVRFWILTRRIFWEALKKVIVKIITCVLGYNHLSYGNVFGNMRLRTAILKRL